MRTFKEFVVDNIYVYSLIAFTVDGREQFWCYLSRSSWIFNLYFFLSFEKTIEDVTIINYYIDCCIIVFYQSFDLSIY